MSLLRIFHPSKDGKSLLLNIIVKPGCKVESIGVGLDALELRVASQPVEGKANLEVIQVIASLFRVGKSTVAVHRGHTSRQKTLAITGISLADAEAVVARLRS